MDWEGFRRLAQFHRIEGLSWEYLSRDQSAVPPSIARTLKEAATAAAIQNLQAISESHRLLVAFSHAAAACAGRAGAERPTAIFLRIWAPIRRTAMKLTIDLTYIPPPAVPNVS